MNKKSIINIFICLIVIFSSGCAYQKCLKTNKPTKDKNFYVKTLEGAIGIPGLSKISFLNNLGLDSIVKWKIDSLGFTITDKTVHDTLEQRLKIYNAKMCYCQFKEKEKRKDKCQKELNAMGDQLLSFLLDNINSIDSMNSQMYKFIYQLYTINLDTIIQSIYEKKSNFYKEIVNKGYPCDTIDLIINSFCKEITSDFESEYKKFLDFQSKHGKTDNREYENYSLTDCKEEFQKLKMVLCDSCDTCGIIKKYCAKKGLNFSKDKCECIKPSPPQTAKTLAEVREAIKSKCSKITTEVTGVNVGKDIFISLLYSADSTVTCYGASNLHRESYGRGEYDLPSDLFEYLNKHFIDTLNYLFERHNWPIDSVLVNVVGMADGYGINPKGYKYERLNIKYHGYNNIRIDDPFEMNGGKYRIVNNYYDTTDCGFNDNENILFTFKNDKQKIDNNIQLAYLRAFPVQKMLKELFPQTSIYTIEMPNANIEGTYRKIEIHILIIGATLGMTGLEKSNNIWLYRMKHCSDR